MKKFLFLLIAPLLCMYACSEDEFDTYDGKDFIYFSKRMDYSITYWDTLKSFNFFFSPGVTDTLYRIPVSTGGIVYDRDRTFLIAVHAEGAQEGIDFEIDRHQVVPAGANTADIPVRLIKTDKLEGNTYSLDIKLQPNEEFDLSLPFIYDKGDTIQRTSMLLEFKAELDEPALYTQRKDMIFGYWSIAKFNEMNRLWGTTIEDWETGGKVSANLNNLVIVFNNYLNSQIAMGPEYAVKDPHPDSERGYMIVDGSYLSIFGIPLVTIPSDFPTTDEWLGKE